MRIHGHKNLGNEEKKIGDICICSLQIKKMMVGRQHVH